MKIIYKYYLIIFFLIQCPMAVFSQENKYTEDFLQFWNDVNENYSYFDKKKTDWNKVKEFYLPEAEKAGNRNELISVFEHALEELYDDHFSLNTNLSSSTRLVPTGLDIRAEFIDGKAIVTEVRKGFSADIAGVKCGMEIISINGVPVELAVNSRTGKCITGSDPEALNYALRMLLAGTYIKEREITFKQNDILTTIKPDEARGNLTDSGRYNSLLEFKILDNNNGYIKFNNSLGETDVIQLFDSALFQLKDTKALILDLRETPSGGNTIVARGIMSRFIKNEMPYQKHVLPIDDKELNIIRSWLELVSPRGSFTYDKPVVVLVNHWTGSMGEGLAVGFDALDRAEIVGTKMAGLNGSINGFQTINFKIPYSFPTEQLYNVNGTPREYFVPDIFIDLSQSEYIDLKDPVLNEGIKALDKK